MNDTLKFESPDGESVEIALLAIATVVEDTPGVYRCQIIQTGREGIEVRLQADRKQEADYVWGDVYYNLKKYLESQGLAQVTIARSKDPPQVNPRSGKFRTVWSEI